MLSSDDVGALYGAPGTPTYFLRVYLGAMAPVEPPNTLTPTDAWGFAGAFVLAENAFAGTPKALAKELGMLQPTPRQRALAWMDARFQISSRVSIQHTGGYRGEVSGGGASLQFGNVTLKLPSQSPVDLSDDGFTFERGWSFVLERVRFGASGLRPAGDVLVAFAGEPAGRVTFSAVWNAYDLFRFFRDDPFDVGPVRAGDVRYFRRQEPRGTYRQFVYPTLAPITDTVEQPTLALDVQLDPGAPFDGERSRMLMQVATVPPWLRGNYAVSASGRPVTLVPLAADAGCRAGFYFGLRPDKPSGLAAYLAPIGPFALELPAGDRASATRAEGLVMCGANGLEYIQACNGDIFDFTPSCPALASDGPAQQDGSDLLDATFTTSWVQFKPGPAPGRRAYFGQPTAAVNFAHGVIPSVRGQTMGLPTAVASLVRELGSQPPPTSPLPAVSRLAAAPSFPLALYGGAFPSDDKTHQAADLLALERSVLAPVRGARLRSGQHPNGALVEDFKPPDPVFADADGAPLAGARTTTPQGFLVDLNSGLPGGAGATGAAGTWAKVLLARSAEQYLAFGPPAGAETVDAWLATTLLRDQVFLVLNDWSRFPMVERVLAVAGFNFEAAPSAKQPAPQQRETVLVFKFATSRPLAELIDDVAAWAKPDVFVGDRDAVFLARRTLQAALATANATKGKPGDPFAYFRDTIAERHEWTGMLSFNGLINGNDMPPDLQMLFAGIDGPLRAHHFGVELNRIVRKLPTTPDIEESALLGVIHYQPSLPVNHPGAAPVQPTGQPDLSVTADALGSEAVTQDEDLHFAVEQLSVAIHNSTVTDFHAQVAVTMGVLFGRAVMIEPAVMTEPASKPANTVRLTGRYQRHGDVGTVTFAVNERSRFSFAMGETTARVLDALLVTGASLVPITSAPSDGLDEDPGSEVRARVTLAGELSFNVDPFPGLRGLDLFSYGKDGRGIGLSGLALDLSCHLNADGQRVGATTIVPNLADVVLADEPSALRAGGLVETLPVSLTGFRQDPQGLDPGKLGALPLNVLELMAPDGEADPKRPAVTRIASKPPYALEFRLPLGSLGALADAHASLDAALLLGWGPSTYAPDDDGAGVFVQLPALSAGAFGFDLQGLLKTTFGDANLMHVELEHGSVYVILFNNVALSLLGFKFPPRVIVDFILFGGVGESPNEGSKSLGWSLAATQLPKSDVTAIDQAV